MTLDGLEERKDALQKTVDSSSVTKETSKVETPETFTKTQIDKAVSDALSKAGREAKTLSELQQRLEKDKAELTVKQVAWQKKQEEAEEEAVMDDPEALTALRERRRKKADDEAETTKLADERKSLASEKQAFEEEKTKLADIVERDRILTRTQLAAEVAVDKKVSIDGILKGIALAKDESREAMEAVAELLPKTEERKVLVSDSSRTNRGGTSPAKAREKMLSGLSKLHPEGK